MPLSPRLWRSTAHSMRRLHSCSTLFCWYTTQALPFAVANAVYSRSYKYGHTHTHTSQGTVGNPLDLVRSASVQALAKEKYGKAQEIIFTAMVHCHHTRSLQLLIVTLITHTPSPVPPATSHGRWACA